MVFSKMLLVTGHRVDVECKRRLNTDEAYNTCASYENILHSGAQLRVFSVRYKNSVFKTRALKRVYPAFIASDTSTYETVNRARFPPQPG